MGVFAERGAFGSVIRGDVSIEFAKRYPSRLVRRDCRQVHRGRANEDDTDRWDRSNDARMRRAERLSSEHSFAAEFLDFYKHVAAFQKHFAQISQLQAE